MREEREGEKMEEIIKKLEALAAKKTWGDGEEYNPMDQSGGNFDDCYDRGCTDGEVNLARELLPQIKLMRHDFELSK